MPASRSKQHEMLIALQISGNEVRYAAPKFHARKDLDANFRNHSLLSRSLYVKPLEIGPLPDAQPHSYAFDAAGNHFFRSDPTLLKANNEYEVFVSELEAKLDGGGIQDSREVGKALQGHLAELALSQIRDPQRDERIGEVWVEAEAKSKAHPLEFCASIVHHLAQASLFWVTRKPPETSTLP